jgi:hypothetical protein
MTSTLIFSGSGVVTEVSSRVALVVDVGDQQSRKSINAMMGFNAIISIAFMLVIPISTILVLEFIQLRGLTTRCLILVVQRLLLSLFRCT